MAIEQAKGRLRRTGARCRDCAFFRRAPQEVSTTGCWHPDHTRAVNLDGFLYQDHTPGDPAKLNPSGSCSDFADRRQNPSFWDRLKSSSGR